MVYANSPKEERLILSSRLLDEGQFEILVDIINFLVSKNERKPPTHEDKMNFIRVMDEIRDKAEKRGLTPEILEQILAEDE